VGACGHALMCQILNVAASREPDFIDSYMMLKAPWRGSRESGYVLSRGDEAGWAGLIGGEIPFAHVCRGGMDYV
jgi:hypothetical protein